MSKTAYMSIDNQLELARWALYWKETNNPLFRDLLYCKSRYLVLKGGGGSGKSIFAGRKILERLVTEPNHRFLVCRKVAKTLRDSCYTQLVQQLREHYPAEKTEINKGDMRIRLPRTNGEIIFSGLDDVEKLKSIYNITGIWIEEASELTEDDFNQLDIRLRGETKYYKQIILSFNPISILHWLKRRFFDIGVDDCTICESTYKDNQFLDAAQKGVLEGFKLTDEYYYQVYCLGNWGVTGKTVFDSRALQARLESLNQPKMVGRMEYDYDMLTIDNYRFTDGDGDISIYSVPQETIPYVIGVDTAGDGSDSCVAQVINALTLEQVAVLRSSDMDEDIFSRQVYSLGKWYNDALIAIESNFSTYPVRELERLGYRHQYVRESVDNYTHEIKKSFGFRTDAKTRPLLVSALVAAVREDASFINDRKTIEEMLTFIRNPDTYKPEAEEGAHDDMVMSLGIALMARNSGQIKLVPITKEVTTEWTSDMWDDYKHAGKEERKYLLEKWGKPKGNKYA